MTASEVIEKITSQATSFFEKATEFRFLLHALCIASYLELAFCGRHAAEVWSKQSAGLCRMNGRYPAVRNPLEISGACGRNFGALCRKVSVGCAPHAGGHEQ